MTKIVLFVLMMLLCVFVADGAAAPFTIIFGDATKDAIETVNLTIEDLEPTIVSVNFDVSPGMSGQEKAQAFAAKLLSPGPGDKFTATVLGASVTVNTRDDVPETLVKIEALDNGGERHILSTPARSGATGTISFVGDLSCVDRQGGPAIYQAGFFSPLLGGSSSPAFDCSDIMKFTGNPPTGAGAAQIVGAFFAILLGPDQLQVVGNTITILFLVAGFGTHSIDAQTTDSTANAPVSLEIP